MQKQLALTILLLALPTLFTAQKDTDEQLQFKLVSDMQIKSPLPDGSKITRKIPRLVR